MVDTKRKTKPEGARKFMIPLVLAIVIPAVLFLGGSGYLPCPLLSGSVGRVLASMRTCPAPIPLDNFEEANMMAYDERELNNPASTFNDPPGKETATFALGCFWGPDALFGGLPGVIRTRVGYAGGTTESPTYRNIGDHTESIQIDYDPNIISYAQLVEIFWENHHPAARPYSRQYMSIIFTHDQTQEQLARETSQKLSEEIGQPVLTEIFPFQHFTRAEDYHQKYSLRQRQAFSRVLSALFPETDQYVDSTLTARLNAFVAGHTNLKLLAEDLSSMELDNATRQSLLEIASQFDRR